MRLSRLALPAVLPVVMTACGGTIGPVHCDPARAAHEAKDDSLHESRVEIDEVQADKGPSPDGIEGLALMEKKILDERACRKQAEEAKAKERRERAEPR
jgi:hypothetical protein